MSSDTTARPPDRGQMRRPGTARVQRVVALLGPVLRRGLRPFLLAIDTVAIVLAAVITDNVTAQAGLLLVAMLMLNGAAGLYSSRLTLSILDDLTALVGRGLAAAAVTASAVLLLNQPPAVRHTIVTAAVAVGLAALGRAAGYFAAREMRRRHLISHRTLVLGAGKVGAQLARLMREHPEYGLFPVGFCDDDPLLDPPDLLVPVLGRFGDLADVITRYQVTQVIVAFGSVRESSMIDILRTCDRLTCEIFYVPRLFEVSTVAGDMDQLWGMPLVRIRRAPFRSISWQIKRVVDIVLTSAALILLAPLMLALAVAVRIDGGPGVLFRQARVGLDGRVFDILKFRSMRPANDNESATRWSIVGDNQLSRLSSFMRAHSLDELPQLWNVVRGDMSLVGPRPERPYFVAEFKETFPRYMARHRVPSGLTGLAQVHGLRGDTSIEDRARFDNSYIENWSLWTDLKLLIKTVGSLLRHADAERPGPAFPSTAAADSAGAPSPERSIGAR
jgi:exopolysaccharide biosynthesis polyprenyl glycosylphosphotransferase